MVPQIAITTAEVAITHTGIRPEVSPLTMSPTSQKTYPRNAEIIPRNIALLKISPHFLSFIPTFVRPPWIFLVRKGTKTSPAAIPTVITHAIVIKIEGSVIVVPALIPAASSALPAATVSYVIEPMTERRSQGSATPRLFERATTPTSTAIAGAIVKTAAELIVFFTVCLDIPSSFALLQALTRKNTD